MLKFVTLADASVGKSSLLAQLTDQCFSTNTNATVSALSPIHTHHMVSWMSLATGNGRMMPLGFGVKSGSKLISIPGKGRQDCQTTMCVFDLHLDCQCLAVRRSLFHYESPILTVLMVL